MQAIERRNLIRAALVADRFADAGKEAWRKALRALVHEQQQLRRGAFATDVMRALVHARMEMFRLDVDEDEAARIVVEMLQLEW